ncbi:Diaminopimelate epimerase-like protein [Venturia nashicola]|uniref:Diaminopimelate epimerase-like protein n=1 Tax=Venturia nashicola TaxID=86259 RepID=A0A4Z1P406_9PEZI|nr:Diaminopimelate epimerase-like protein [Venturia nashicola]
MARSALAYVTVDVFTNEKFAGNQLAIVEIPKNGSILTQEEKLDIAREFSYSETVFVFAQNENEKANNEWTINIFTTEEELPFAGHPVIGTACFLLGRIETNEHVIRGAFQAKAGRIDLLYDVVKRIANAAIPHNLRVHQDSLQSTQLQKLQPNIGRFPAVSPIVSIVKGMTFALVELDSLDTLTFINTTPFPIEAKLDHGWDASFIACYFYVKLGHSEKGTVRLRTRMIECGVGEDAATGSAACTLASFLTIQDGRDASSTTYDIVQGVEMGRRSEIGVTVKLGPGRAIESVTLSGSSVQMMEGRLFL